MKIVFLSCHFGDGDHVLVQQVTDLLESHGLLVKDGRDLGGGAVTPKVLERVVNSDALVALMTKRDSPDANGGTHPWVVQEYDHAKVNKKNAIALVAPGVALAGANLNDEKIDYDPANPVKALVKLSKTIGV